MKGARVVSTTLIVGACCVLLLASLAMDSGVQTWAVRRSLSNRPNLRGSVESVSALPGSVRIQGLRLERNGAVLALPSLEADIPVLPAALWHGVAIRKLVAKGWVLDLTKASGGAAARSVASALIPAEPATLAVGRSNGIVPSARADAAGPPSLASRASAGRAARAFQGIFSNLRLPIDLSVNEVELEGDVIVRHPGAGALAPLTLHVIFYGGGLAAGREGRFTFSVAAAPVASADEPVDSMTVNGTLGATMDTPRSFTRTLAHVNAAAKGPKFPNGVRLSADFAASGGAFGESYALAFTGEAKELATIAADFSRATGRVSGTWKLDVRDDDLVPFVFGRPLPLFDLVGSGRFNSDASLVEAQVSGSLDATADRLAAVSPEFSAIGAVRLKADFDLTRRGSLYRVDHLRASLSGANPVLTIEGLQAFAFNAGTGELQVADTGRDLVGVTLQGVPLEWAQPFLPGVRLTGTPVRGGLVAMAGSGGLAVRTRAPLEFSGLSIARNGLPVARDVDLQLEFSADYTPQGWQIELSRCAAIGPAPGGGPGAGSQPDPRSSFLALSAKCGRLAGANQPIKLAGRLDAQLPLLLAQPGIASMFRPGAGSALASGEFACDFSANLAGRRLVETKLAISKLALARPARSPAGDEEGPEPDGPLPLADITSDARFEIGADGRAAVTLPVLFQEGGRKSDATLKGTVFLEGKTVVIEGEVSSDNIAVDEVAPLAALFGAGEDAQMDRPGETRLAVKSAPVSDAAPPWARFGGQLKVALARVERANAVFSGVSGTVRAEASSLQVDGLRVGFGDGGSARLTGVLAFAPGAVRPYSLRADLAVEGLNAAPIFLAANPGAPPTLDGKFDLAAHVLGDGSDFAGLLGRCHGDCQATSKGGTFRVLSPGAAPKPETVGKIGAAVAYIGSVTSAITGRKDSGDLSNLAEAVTALVNSLRTIQYDQLSVALSRDESLDTVLRDFTLISPEIRLGGGGRLSGQDGVPILAQPLSMDFKLLARGHEAELLKYLGALDPKKPDDLGYLPCTLPIHIGGSLAKPDHSQFDVSLAKLAVERSGAGDLLNKLLGR